MRRSLSALSVLLVVALPAYAQENMVNPLPFLLVPLLAIFIFLVCRELICWYWKINQVVTLLTEIRDLLKNNRTP